MDEWRPTATETTHHADNKRAPTVPPSPSKSSKSDCFLVLIHLELKPAHTRELNHKSQGGKTKE